MKREDLIAPEEYNLVEEIEKFAVNPEKIAIKFENELGSKDYITYDALIRRANQVANVFVKHGLQKGDVVLIMVPRLIDAYITYVAALKAGLVVIPSSEMLRAKEIDYRLVHSNAKAVIAYEPFLEQFDQVKNLQNVQQYVIGQGHASWIEMIQEAEKESEQFVNAKTKSEDMAFLSYTSGTTGNPKGAMIPNNCIMDIKAIC